MNNTNRFFEDLTKLAGNAMGVAFQSANEMKERFDTTIREQVQKVATQMGFVRREEFETVKKMAAKAREENAALAKRLKKLEGKKSTSSKKKKII